MVRGTNDDSAMGRQPRHFAPRFYPASRIVRGPRANETLHYPTTPILAAGVARRPLSEGVPPLLDLRRTTSGIQLRARARRPTPANLGPRRAAEGGTRRAPDLPSSSRPVRQLQCLVVPRAPRPEL